MSVQALPDWLAELQITNLDVSFCKGCNISVVSTMTSLQVLSLQVGFNWDCHMPPSKCGHEIVCALLRCPCLCLKLEGQTEAITGLVAHEGTS